MTTRHSTLFTLGAGKSGLSFYTTQRDAAKGWEHTRQNLHQHDLTSREMMDFSRPWVANLSIQAAMGKGLGEAGQIGCRGWFFDGSGHKLRV